MHASRRSYVVHGFGQPYGPQSRRGGPRSLSYAANLLRVALAAPEPNPRMLALVWCTSPDHFCRETRVIALSEMLKTHNKQHHIVVHGKGSSIVQPRRHPIYGRGLMLCNLWVDCPVGAWYAIVRLIRCCAGPASS